MNSKIDLETCKRPEFIEHEANLQGYIKHLEDELEIVNKKLLEYEGVKPTQEEAEKEFQKFWSAYGRKGNLKQTRRRWFNLSNKKQSLAMDKVTAYVKSTPEKCYRKGGEVWLLNECWNDEIVEAAQPFGRPPAVRAMTSIIEDAITETARLQEASKLRQANRGRNVKDLLK